MYMPGTICTATMITTMINAYSTLEPSLYRRLRYSLKVNTRSLRYTGRNT